MHKKKESLWKHWYGLFLRREERKFPPEFRESLNLSDEQKKLFLHSLAVFQLGETGEGRIGREIDSVDFFPVDQEYKESLRLFIKEEGRHARLLGICLRSMDGKFLEKNAGKSLFELVRTLLGVRLKLTVLFAVEIVGIVFYKMISSALPASKLRSILEEIAQDEILHLRFHSEFFRLYLGNIFTKSVFCIFWGSITILSLSLMYLGERNTFSAFGIRFSEVLSLTFRMMYFPICQILEVSSFAPVLKEEVL